MKINIKVSNLNNSIVFYKNLLGGKPVHIGVFKAIFYHKHIKIILIETNVIDRLSEPYLLLIPKIDDLVDLYKRIKRFIKSNGKGCSILENRIGVIDPDGHKWLILIDGTKMSGIDEIEFANCFNEPYLLSG